MMWLVETMIPGALGEDESQESSSYDEYETALLEALVLEDEGEDVQVREVGDGEPRWARFWGRGTSGRDDTWSASAGDRCICSLSSRIAAPAGCAGVTRGGRYEESGPD